MTRIRQTEITSPERGVEVKRVRVVDVKDNEVPQGAEIVDKDTPLTDWTEVN